MNQNLILFFTFLVFYFSGGPKTTAQTPINELQKLRTQVLNATNQEERVKFNNFFITKLNEVLEEKESFQYTWDSIPKIGVLTEKTHDQLRIINWNIPFEDGTFQYFGYVQQILPDGEYVVTELTDNSASAPRSIEMKKLNASNWYGCLYYELIPVFKKHEVEYYLALGWDGNDRFSTKKLIEVISIDKNGRLNFGDNVFKGEDYSTKRRVIFEFTADVVMTLRYEPKKKRIVFDHLSPMKDELEGVYQFYAPDMRYDQLTFKRGKWEFEHDVDARLKNTNQPYNAPK